MSKAAVEGLQEEPALLELLLPGIADVFKDGESFAPGERTRPNHHVIPEAILWSASHPEADAYPARGMVVTSRNYVGMLHSQGWSCQG